MLTPQNYKTLLLNAFLCCSGVLFFAACQSDDPDSPADKPYLVYSYNIQDAPVYEGFKQAQNQGLIQNTLIDEASGLAVSRSNPNYIWTHNDKGDINRLFVLDHNAQDLGYYRIDGAINRDWEDICIGPGPDSLIMYLYVGDIGDNDAVYPSIMIYRFPEPDLTLLTAPTIGVVPQALVQTLICLYPDGPKDAEALMIDPLTRDLYIITKRGEHSLMYKAPFPQSTQSPILLQKVAQFPFNRVLASDISARGDEILVKTDERILYWKRNHNESVEQALSRMPYSIPYTLEPQGEAIGWAPNAQGFYTLSEWVQPIQPPLYYYERKP